MEYKSKIPKRFVQTGLVPLDASLLTMIREKLGHDWKYEFYNDEDIITFFKNNPIDELPDIISKFHSIKHGPHKADLFRYYYLYVNGGVYMDTDAMIYENIENIIKEYDFITVLSAGCPGTIFQGVIGCEPKHDIIKLALWDAYNTDPTILLSDYHYWCRQLYNILKNNKNEYSIKLYSEESGEPGICRVMDANTILFKHFYYYKVIPTIQS